MDLTRTESIVLIQLRTGKIDFRAYLYRIGAVDSALCHCSQDAQTINQILIDCWTYDDLWQQLWNRDDPNTAILVFNRRRITITFTPCDYEEDLQSDDFDDWYALYSILFTT